MITESWEPLGTAFYQREDVSGIARGLLGKVLWVAHDGGRKALVITETEAYEGITDRASHAWGGRRTARTATMYLRGGHAYVYLCYGMHWLFNVVTAGEGNPHAVLVRGGVPFEHFHAALAGREWKKHLVSGPGRVTRYLGIDKAHNGLWLPGHAGIGLSDAGFGMETFPIQATPRIGVDYAGDHASWLYRFVWKGGST